MEIRAHDSAIDPEKSGEAGALGCRNVEITPAMIEAGVSVVHEFEPFFVMSPTLDEALVRSILEGVLFGFFGRALEASQMKRGQLYG